MKARPIAALFVILLSFGAYIFIHFSNDHVECQTTIETTYGGNGEKITTEKHICFETYNF